MAGSDHVDFEATDDVAVLENPGEPVTPVPVHGVVRITERVPTSEEAADFGNYRTVSLAGLTTDDKQQILPYDRHRVRAYILVVSGTSAIVYVGSEAQCAAVKAGHPEAGGFQLLAGQFLEVRHKETVWMISDLAHAAVVSIAQERMRT